MEGTPIGAPKEPFKCTVSQPIASRHWIKKHGRKASRDLVGDDPNVDLEDIKANLPPRFQAFRSEASRLVPFGN
jgi:hypothetical protein